MPFIDAYARASHFKRHGHEFGAITEEEYEQLADAFMARALSPILQECIRIMSPDQDRVRLHFDRGNFGVSYGHAVLRTYHVKAQGKIRTRGAAAGLLAYECGRADI